MKFMNEQCCYKKYRISGKAEGILDIIIIDDYSVYVIMYTLNN